MPQQGTKRVEFEGQTHEFPADFSDADIQKALSSHSPSGASAPNVNPTTGITAPQGTESGFGQTAVNFGKNVWEGAKGAVSTGVDIAKDLASNPNWAATMPAGQRPSTMQKYVTDPARQMAGKAQDAFGKGRYSEAAGYGGAAAFPGMGPWAASLGEQAGQGDISGAAGQLVGGLGGAKIAGKVGGAAVDLPKTALEFTRRATSLNEVTKAGAGVYQGKVQPLIQTLRGAIQNEGARTIQQAIEADKAATMQQGRGTISPSAAVASAAQAIEDTGHMPSAQTRALLSRLNNSSFLTLEDAKNLRSDFGGAASKADRAGNAKLGKVLWSAYDELGNGMKDRIKELQGTTEPFDHYNNEFRSYYELNKGIAGSMQDSIMDRHEAIPKLREFSDADLTEIKDQAKKYGMDPAKFDEAQKNSRSVAAAHDSLSGKYNKSLYRIMLSGGTSAATIAAPLAIYAAAHGAGLYGIAPLLAASYVGAKLKGLEPEMETGSILRKLNVDPDKFQVRNPVEGPKTFDYPNQDDVYNPPSGPTPSAPPAEPEPFSPEDQAAQVAKLQALRASALPQRSVRPEMSPLEKPLWQETAFGQKPSEDIGSKVRAANPEPTRKEVKAAAIKKAKNR